MVTTDLSPHLEHKDQAPKRVACWVITVSDTRTPETDRSGQLIMASLQEQGHEVAGYRLVRDEPEQIRQAIQEGLQARRGEVILTSGGTGIARRDGTYEVVDGLLEKRLDGFGELFRYLSYAEIGSAAMMSRAVAGLAQGKIIVAMPGSSNAVRLAMEKLVLPELGHLVQQIRS